MAVPHFGHGGRVIAAAWVGLSGAIGRSLLQAGALANSQPPTPGCSFLSRWYFHVSTKAGIASPVPSTGLHLFAARAISSRLRSRSSSVLHPLQTLPPILEIRYGSRLDAFQQLREAYMLNHIPPLASAFVGGVLLYLSVYLPVQSIIFPTILAGAGTMALAYSYGTLRQMTR
jgi:hypothetical protein